MSGVLGAVSGSTLFYVVGITNITINDSADTESAYRVKSDGTVTAITSAAGENFYENWVTPPAAAGAASFSVRATLNSGSLASGDVDTWDALTSTRTWNVTGTNANLTIEISDDGGTTTLSSATITLTT